MDSDPSTGLRGEYIEWDMYQNNQDCEWTLTLPQGYGVSIQGGTCAQNNQDCEWNSDPTTGLWGEYTGWDMYPNNQDCEWTLSLPQGYGVSIQQVGL